MNDVDLSDAGIRNIVSTLAAAGVTVHYHETDGDTCLDMCLTPVDVGLFATMLSWRENSHWEIRDYTVDEPEPVAIYRLTAPPSDLRRMAAEVAELDVRPDTGGGAR